MNYVMAILMFFPVTLFAADDHHIQDSKKCPLAYYAHEDRGEIKISINHSKKGQRKLEALSKPSDLKKKPATKPGHKRSASLSDLPSKDPGHNKEHILDLGDEENYNPEKHPVLSQSEFAKSYVRCTTTCWYLSEKWFRTIGFLADVTKSALQGIAYGASDVTLKDNLILTSMILTVISATSKKLEKYSQEAVRNQEKEFKMFDIKEKKELKTFNNEDDLV